MSRPCSAQLYQVVLRPLRLCDFLSPQAGRPASPCRGQACGDGRQSFAARAQEGAEQATLVGRQKHGDRIYQDISPTCTGGDPRAEG